MDRDRPTRIAALAPTPASPLSLGAPHGITRRERERVSAPRPYGARSATASGLPRQERQRHDTVTVNLQWWREDFGGAEGEEIAGPVDRTQFLGTFRRDRDTATFHHLVGRWRARRFIARSMTSSVAGHTRPYPLAGSPA
jgi:hypothetical protein